MATSVALFDGSSQSSVAEGDDAMIATNGSWQSGGIRTKSPQGATERAGLRVAPPAFVSPPAGAEERAGEGGRSPAAAGDNTRAALWGGVGAAGRGIPAAPASLHLVYMHAPPLELVA